MDIDTIDVALDRKLYREAVILGKKNDKAFTQEFKEFGLARVDDCIGRCIDVSTRLLLIEKMMDLGNIYILNNKKLMDFMKKKFKRFEGFKIMKFGPLIPTIFYDKDEEIVVIWYETYELRLVDV